MSSCFLIHCLHREAWIRNSFIDTHWHFCFANFFSSNSRTYEAKEKTQGTHSILLLEPPDCLPVYLLLPSVHFIYNNPGYNYTQGRIYSISLQSWFLPLFYKQLSKKYWWLELEKNCIKIQDNKKINRKYSHHMATLFWISNVKIPTSFFHWESPSHSFEATVLMTF